ncbi:glycerol-3-phosphate dehydrogenase, partial [Desulfobulbus sp. TB]|nr:glycerol-3-phosphate dehydrogenase [Desulfobulbus sp. TB]
MKLKPVRQTAVIGAGSWGTALAKLLADKGKPVLLWSHRATHVDALRRDRENRKYLPGATLPDTLQAVTTFDDLPSCQCVV